MRKLSIFFAIALTSGSIYAETKDHENKKLDLFYTSDLYDKLLKHRNEILFIINDMHKKEFPFDDKAAIIESDLMMIKKTYEEILTIYYLKDF